MDLQPIPWYNRSQTTKISKKKKNLQFVNTSFSLFPTFVLYSFFLATVFPFRIHCGFCNTGTKSRISSRSDYGAVSRIEKPMQVGHLWIRSIYFGITVLTWRLTRSRLGDECKMDIVRYTNTERADLLRIVRKKTISSGEKKNMRSFFFSNSQIYQKGFEHFFFFQNEYRKVSTWDTRTSENVRHVFVTVPTRCNFSYNK